MAVLDQVRFTRCKYEFAAGDVDLASAEVNGIETLVDRLDDVLGRRFSGHHKGVCHARHWNVVVTLAPAVAGQRGIHELGTELILKVSLENSFFDQHGFVRRIPFVVHVERTTSKRDCSIVNHGAKLGSDLLADEPGKRRRLLAIEIRFEAMADRFVQKDAGPAGAKNDFHRAGRGVDRAKLENRLPRTFPREFARIEIGRKDIQRSTAPTTLVSRLAFAVFFGNAHNIEPDQRLKIPCRASFRRRDEHMLCLVHVAGLNLLDPSIVSARSLVGLLEQGNLMGDLELGGKDGNRIQIPFLIQRCRDLKSSAGGRGIGDKRRGTRSLEDIFPIEVRRIRISGLLSRNDANADADTHTLGCALDDLFFENDRMVDSIFEVEIGVIAATEERFGQVGFQVACSYVVLFEKNRFIEIHSY